MECARVNCVRRQSVMKWGHFVISSKALLSKLLSEVLQAETNSQLGQKILLQLMKMASKQALAPQRWLKNIFLSFFFLYSPLILSASRWCWCICVLGSPFRNLSFPYFVFQWVCVWERAAFVSVYMWLLVPVIEDKPSLKVNQTFKSPNTITLF